MNSTTTAAGPILLVTVLLAGCSASAGADASASGDQASTEEAPLAPGEPPYCLLNGLRAHEISIDTHGLENAHAFRLGDVTLVGVAVGDSKVDALQSLATSTATNLTPEQHSCTFYFNDGNDAAQVAFNWYDLPKPIGDDYAGMTSEYAKDLANIFDTANPSILSCAAGAQYVAMGCDGMKHRGPTVFASTLAYSGCSPEHATSIVNAIWGKNGIDPQMRISITTWAKSVAANHPAQAGQLQKLFLAHSDTPSSSNPAPSQP
jgi:hypothetical protein